MYPGNPFYELCDREKFEAYKFYLQCEYARLCYFLHIPLSTNAI